MTDWADAVHQGVAALDFRLVGVDASPVRPPEDADAMRALFAATQLHYLLPTLAKSGRYPRALAAWDALRRLATNEKAGASQGELSLLLTSYRQALTDALLEYTADDPTTQLAELERRYDDFRQTLD